MNAAVRQTRSGLIVRYDDGLGLLVYSPYSGLIFAVRPADAPQVSAWLDMDLPLPPSLEYEQALAPGWYSPLAGAHYPVSRVLHDTGPATISPTIEAPIVVNWLITGMCPLHCRYCDANDLMRAREPRPADIVRRVEAILALRPLVVVLTGGDPLVSPHLPQAIGLLAGHAGIMVDTNAYCLNDEHLALFREHRVAVRISFDSEIPRANQALRPYYVESQRSRGGSPTTLEAAVSGLCRCLEAGLAVSVQSVASKDTSEDLMALGDKLYHLGVRSWRILKIQPSQTRLDAYEQLLGPADQQARLYGQVFARLVSTQQRRWPEMALQITENRSLNSVILAAPDGRMLTESNQGAGKVQLDDLRPASPRPDRVFERVDMQAHLQRYLGR